MRRVNDLEQVEILLQKNGIRKYFSTPNLCFDMYQYEKGEFITNPNIQLENILFVISGTIRIYGLRENGAIAPVNHLNAPTIIGDMEFIQQEAPPFFVEAMSDVTCLGLPFKKYKTQLNVDILFLHTLLHSYAEKMKLFALVDIPAETIEDRVLLYLKNFCPSYELIGIEAATLQLRCSRRQLQRVLKNLCNEGKVEKIGKGRYKLIENY